MLVQYVNPASALQLDHSFARFFNVSSATAVDRENGSGNWSSNVPEQLGCPLHGWRIGEANNPGPEPCQDMLLNVGLSNPGGLRGKEDMLLALGPGIWTMSETHHSQVTMKTTARTLRTGGIKLHRQIRPHFSHPAPLRQGSTWAGKWTGVSTVSDWPSSQLTLPWPSEHWATGRVLLTRHWLHQLLITVGGFYGYAQGPTWPRARQQSDQLLETFTQQLVIGMGGIRLISGDFNFDPGELVQQQLDGVMHKILLPRCSFMKLPSEIPWQSINTDDWQPSCTTRISAFDDSSDFLSSWSAEYEAAISHQHQQQHGDLLHPRFCGRAQRRKPERQSLAPEVCKPSREGEVCLQGSLVGVAVRKWFKQFRRLQSLSHATAAAKQSPAALQYKASLWTAIVNAKGFFPSVVESTRIAM
eukprot:s2118_g8.t1